jgi:hypothetical protein
MKQLFNFQLVFDLKVTALLLQSSKPTLSMFTIESKELSFLATPTDDYSNS